LIDPSHSSQIACWPHPDQGPSSGAAKIPDNFCNLKKAPSGVGIQKSGFIENEVERRQKKQHYIHIVVIYFERDLDENNLKE